MLKRLHRITRRATPSFVQRSLEKWWLKLNYDYDRKRFLRHSAAFRKCDVDPDAQMQLRSIITMDYHRLEKGLALTSPRPGFGVQVVQNLLKNIAIYQARYGMDETIAVSAGAMNAYQAFQVQQGTQNEDLGKAITSLQSDVANWRADCNEGGTAEIRREELYQRASESLSGLIETRHSIRQFTNQPVADELIDQAVKLAMRSPSVCNRQAWRVYDVPRGPKMQAVLACQNGNGGFRSEIGRTLVVAADTRNFVSVGERNQPWIDGGMFAMSLIYALHSMQLGSCALNWSMAKYGDARLRETIPIADHDCIIMLIAVGHLPEQFRIAQSPRRPLSEILVRLKDD